MDPLARALRFTWSVDEAAAAMATDVVFIVADARDWPKELDGRVGFVPLARRGQLHRPAEPGR